MQETKSTLLRHHPHIAVVDVVLQKRLQVVDVFLLMKKTRNSILPKNPALSSLLPIHTPSSFDNRPSIPSHLTMAMNIERRDERDSDRRVGVNNVDAVNCCEWTTIPRVKIWIYRVFAPDVLIWLMGYNCGEAMMRKSVTRHRNEISHLQRTPPPVTLLHFIYWKPFVTIKEFEIFVKFNFHRMLSSRRICVIIF